MVFAALDLPYRMAGFAVRDWGCMRYLCSCWAEPAIDSFTKLSFTIISWGPKLSVLIVVQNFFETFIIICVPCSNGEENPKSKIR